MSAISQHFEAVVFELFHTLHDQAVRTNIPLSATAEQLLAAPSPVAGRLTSLGEDSFWIASAARYVLRNLTEDANLEKLDRAGLLIQRFGEVFQGNVVGHPGRDLIERYAFHAYPPLMMSACGVLAKWSREDPEGPWGEILLRAARGESSDEVCGDLEISNDELPEDISAKLKHPHCYMEAAVSSKVLVELLQRLLDFHPTTTLALIEGVRTGHAHFPDAPFTAEIFLQEGSTSLVAYCLKWGIVLSQSGDSENWAVYLSF